MNTLAYGPDDPLTNDDMELIQCGSPEVISQSAFDSLLDIYPNIEGHPEYIRFLRYLTVSPWEEEPGAIIIPAKTLARFWNQENQLRQRNFPAYERIVEFQDSLDVDFTLSGWSFDFNEGLTRRNKARTIKGLKIPTGVQSIFSEEAELKNHHQGMFWVPPMKQLTYKRQRVLREEMKSEAGSAARRARCAVATGWLSHLNGLPSNRFAAVARRCSDVRDAILAEPPSKARRQALRVLGNIWAQPQPFYRPTENSVRIYPTCEHIGSLPKRWRKGLAPAWVDADLKSCYLSIAATLWNIPEAQTILGSGTSVWPLLCNSLGIDPSPENKDKLKPILYGVFFGMGPDKRAIKIRQAFGINAVAKFENSSLIKAIRVARLRKVRQINKMGGAADCFGNWLSRDKYRAHSISAQLMQAYEMNLLEPALTMFRENSFRHGASCTLFQHDGFSFVVTDAVDLQDWKDELRRVVRQRASNLGVNTDLEFT